MKKEWSYRAKSIQDCSTAIKSQHWFFIHIYREMHIHTMPCCSSLVRNPAWHTWLIKPIWCMEQTQAVSWHSSPALCYWDQHFTSTVLSAHLHEDSDYRHTLTTRPDMPDESSHHVTPQENLHELKSFRLFQYFLSPIKQIRELQELVLGQESLQEGVSVFW